MWRRHLGTTALPRGRANRPDSHGIQTSRSNTSQRLLADIVAVLHAVEMNLVYAVVGAGDRVLECGGVAHHGQHASTCGDEASVLHGGAGVINVDSRNRLRLLDAVNHLARTR